MGGAAASNDDVGYLLGGAAFNDNDESGELRMVPGLLSYNMTTNAFQRDSATGLHPTSTTVYGRMHFAADYGSQGLLIALGGVAGVGRKGTTYAGDPANAYHFDDIAVYDPAKGSWYHQKTTAATEGAVPSDRSSFCSVAVNGSNGTYEMCVISLLHLFSPRKRI